MVYTKHRHGIKVQKAFTTEQWHPMRSNKFDRKPLSYKIPNIKEGLNTPLLQQPFQFIQKFSYRHYKII